MAVTFFLSRLYLSYNLQYIVMSNGSWSLEKILQCLLVILRPPM
jgi:hypothetical protein